MQAIDALLRRRSARALTAPAPDAAALELMLASAVRAPDHGRLRPWRFVVVREAGRARFGELLAAHLRRMQPQASPEAVQRERDKALRAPLIVVVAARVDPAVTKIPAIEQTLSAGAAAGNIMLAAFALGFNAMWKTGGAAYDAVVKQALGLEPADAIVGFLYIGTEAPPLALPAAGEWRDLVREF
jgi:nitroreductase